MFPIKYSILAPSPIPKLGLIWYLTSTAYFFSKALTCCVSSSEGEQLKMVILSCEESKDLILSKLFKKEASLLWLKTTISNRLISGGIQIFGPQLFKL